MIISNGGISINTINIIGDKNLLRSEVESVKTEIQSELNKVFSELLNTMNDSTSKNDTSSSSPSDSSFSEETTGSNKDSQINIGTINVYLNDILENIDSYTSTDKNVNAVSNSSDFSSLPFNVPSEYHSIINEMASKYNVKPEVVASVMYAESTFKPYAVSSSGAEGLMQLMPDTAKYLGVKDSFDISQNIEGGTKYLSQMLKKYDNNLSLALAAYNAGPGNVDRYGGIPPFKETQNYVSKILSKLA